jgi:hypothetical protein
MALQDPAAASGGMAAFGDVLLALFLGGLFLIPSVFLIRILANSETRFLTLSRFLLGLGLSAPVCMIVVVLGENHVAGALSWVCFFRLLESPVILVAMAAARVSARFDSAKKLISRALLIEGLTLVGPVAAFVVTLFVHK